MVCQLVIMYRTFIIMSAVVCLLVVMIIEYLRRCTEPVLYRDCAIQKLFIIIIIIINIFNLLLRDF